MSRQMASREPKKPIDLARYKAGPPESRDPGPRERYGPWALGKAPEKRELLGDEGWRLWRAMDADRAARRASGRDQMAMFDWAPKPSEDVRSTLGAELRTRRGKAERERMDFIDWAQEVPEPKAGRLDFARFPFQVELYGGRSAREKDLVVKKATQLGISAWLFRWAMYWADMRSLNALYVFPRLKQMYDFGDARVRASILKSPFLQKRIPTASVQNKGLKQVGGGFVYFRGSESIDDLESVDADVLALDEYDRLVPENVPIAERRIGASLLGLVRRVGVPSLPNVGVSKLYEESNGNSWLVKCRCGHEQDLDWTRNVCLEREIRRCAKCELELRPQEVAGGRWVTQRPDSTSLGFHLNRLTVPEVDIAQLVANSRKTSPAERASFWQRDMGEAYAEEEGRISAEALEACQSAGQDAGVEQRLGYDGDLTVTMGVDVASVRNLSVRISGRSTRSRRKAALWIGEVDDFGKLEDLMRRFRVSICCVDHMPEHRLARAFAERFPGRVYLVRYSAGVMQRAFALDERGRAVTVRRVDAIDATLDALRSVRNLLPRSLPEGYADQLMALQRVVESDDRGVQKVRYVSTGRDDYAHAEVYDLVAWEVLMYRMGVAEALREDVSSLDKMLPEYRRTVLHQEDPGYVELSDQRPADPEEYRELGEHGE